MKKNMNAGLKNWDQNRIPIKELLTTSITLRVNFILIFFMLSSFVSAHADSSGKDLFNKNCIICHADDGSGAMPGVLDLTENSNWSMLPEHQLLTNLNKGSQRPGASMSMPPKGGNPNLTDKELLSIISYMRKEFLK